ncbi:MAG: hypothetical protein GY708_05165 [Actinomycetia bacterium]|nr:hypothetical protein [Actinomycetes bacterium]
MTEKFVTAADLMARVLGADGFAFAIIPHPISSASPDDLMSAANQAADACAAQLTGNQI